MPENYSFEHRNAFYSFEHRNAFRAFMALFPHKHVLASVLKARDACVYVRILKFQGCLEGSCFGSRCVKKQKFREKPKT
jgi:hypothetical protein